MLLALAALALAFGRLDLGPTRLDLLAFAGDGPRPLLLGAVRRDLGGEASGIDRGVRRR